MNLEALRQKILGQTTTAQVGGETYRIVKIGAVDGLALNAMLKSLPTTGEGDKLNIDGPENLVRFYAFLLSKCIVDEGNNKTLDCDEGRALLAQLPRGDLFDLANKATDWNAPQKKS